MAVLHVACAAEGAYIAHSAAMLHSLLSWSGTHTVHAHYLHGPSAPRRSLARLDRMVSSLGGRMTAHEIAPERVAALPAPAEFTPAMWYRILLPELLPGVDRVLYLDVDTLALGPVAELWDTDLAGCYLAAVTNVLLPVHADRPAALGLDPSAYFNSGVLLLNLAEMRRDDVTRSLREFATDRDLLWPDQDALNVVLGGRRRALHPRWNVMNALRWDVAAQVFGAEELEEALTAPRIRHFEGPATSKPWHPECRWEHMGDYWRHRRQTPWTDSRLPAPLAALRRRLGA